VGGLGYTLSSWAGGKVWAFGQDGNVRVAVHGDLAANNGDALLAAAVGGQGVITQPDFIVSDAVKRGELVVLELDQPTYALGGIFAVYPPDRRPPTADRRPPTAGQGAGDDRLPRRALRLIVLRLAASLNRAERRSQNVGAAHAVPMTAST